MGDRTDMCAQGRIPCSAADHGQSGFTATVDKLRGGVPDVRLCCGPHVRVPLLPRHQYIVEGRLGAHLQLSVHPWVIRCPVSHERGQSPSAQEANAAAALLRFVEGEAEQCLTVLAYVDAHYQVAVRGVALDRTDTTGQFVAPMTAMLTEPRTKPMTGPSAREPRTIMSESAADSDSTSMGLPSTERMLMSRAGNVLRSSSAVWTRRCCAERRPGLSGARKTCPRADGSWT